MIDPIKKDLPGTKEVANLIFESRGVMQRTEDLVEKVLARRKDAGGQQGGALFQSNNQKNAELEELLGLLDQSLSSVDQLVAKLDVALTQMEQHSLGGMGLGSSNAADQAENND